MKPNQALCKVLEWDSAFFGVPVARIVPSHLTAETMAQAIAWCEGHAIRQVYLLVPADDTPTVRLAEDHAFRFVDIRVTLDRPLGQGATLPTVPDVRPAMPDDVPQLRAIARRSFGAARFFHDPHITPQQAETLYETWIARSADGYADAVLVAEHASEVAGFISCHVSSDTGSIGLLGVSSAARGSGIGTRLVMAALQWFEMRSLKRVEVVTQGRNVAGQRVYQSCGFKTCAVELWYHRWFDEKQRES